MDILWKKESNEGGALFVDLFKNISTTHPDQHERVSMTFSTIQNLKASGIPLHSYSKDVETSTEYRKQGNMKFLDKKWTEAIQLYNKSLCFAPIGSENISLAYGNRSDCFFHMRMYEECVVDIDLAIKANHRQQSMPKLIKRRTDCLKLMQNESQIKESVPKLSYDANKSYPAMANVLNVELVGGYGRGIVAKDDIDVGKTILVEKAFVSQPQAAECTNCSICMKKLANFIACDKCSSAMFCTSNCITKKHIHRMECGFWLNSSSNLEFMKRFVFIGLSMFSDSNEFMKYVEHIVRQKRVGDAQPISKNLVDAKSKYQAFLQLNMFLSPNDWEEAFGQSYMIYTTLLLHDPIKKMFNSERKKRFLMHLVAYNYCVVQSNRFKEVDPTKTMFLNLAYFNHACVPNVFVFDVDNLSIAITLRPIKNGDQLFVSYAGNAGGLKFIDQAYLLHNFGFQCKCGKCVPDETTMIASQIQRDPEYQFVLKAFCAQPQLNFEETKSKKIQNMCYSLLKRYGDMRWCKEYGNVMNGYALVTAAEMKRKN